MMERVKQQPPQTNNKIYRDMDGLLLLVIHMILNNNIHV